MFEPQDLPGRFGRVVRDIDHVLAATDCPAVLAGGWAVWRHGYVGRITQDVDVALPKDKVAEFLRAAALAGFVVLSQEPGRWPKLEHRETGIRVDILPEGERPGTASRPAPTVIRNPTAMGADGPRLCYVGVDSLFELKLAAGRARDESDLVELIRAHPERIASIREHVSKIHPNYAEALDRLVQRADEQEDH